MAVCSAQQNYRCLIACRRRSTGGCRKRRAKRLSDAAFMRIERDFAIGKISRAKLENRPEKFIETGAPVIKDYKDFCACLAETPGGRSFTISDNDKPELPVI